MIEIFGFEGRELRAGDWNELVHPDDFPLYRAALRDCFRGITPRLDCEYRIRHNDGTYRWIEDRAVAVRNAAGWAIRLTGAIADISARKATEEALREALEQQTATSDVLRVISSSPGDVEPVFQAMLANATRVCDANFGTLFRYDGNGLRWAASVGAPPAYVDFQKPRGSFHPLPGTLHDRVFKTKQVAHSADYAAEPNPGYSVTLGGARSTVEMG